MPPTSSATGSEPLAVLLPPMQQQPPLPPAEEPRADPNESPLVDPAAPGLLRTLAGWACIGLGIIGLFLPILQGVALIVAGAALLGPHSYPGRKILEWRGRYEQWRERRASAR